MKHIYSPTKFLTALSFLIAITLTATAQNNVGIGTTTPNSKAILELQATDKGLLVPRMNTAFMNAIAPTATESALLIYNTDSACYYFYNGTAWKNLCQQALDTALINKAIKNFLSTQSTTVINNTTINNANIDSSTTNVSVINNATINQLTVDTSITNVATINSATINIANIDTSITNVANIGTSNTNIANINNAIIDSSTTNYANINNLVVDSTQANFIQTNTINSNTFNGGVSNMDSLYIGGQNITSVITDSIAAQAWLLKGNNALSSNKLGTLNAQDLHIVANNIERITIANGTGNVGVFQPLPAERLDVSGNIKYTGALMPNGLAGTTGDVLISQGAGVAPQWQNGSTLGSTLNNVSWSLLGNTGTNPNTNFVGTTDNKSLRFRTNNTQKMIVDSLGNVGIGTNAPARLLHLKSNYPLLIDGTVKSWLLGPSNTGNDFNIWDDGLGAGIANVFRIDNSRNIIANLNGGNFGIGTATPISKLHLENGIFTQHQTTDVSHSLVLFNTVSNRGWQTYHLSSTDATPNGYMLEYFDGSAWNRRMTIDQTGNMGLGTGSTPPSAKLEVNSGTAAVSGLKLTQLSGMNSTSISNYATVLYSGAQMEPGNSGFVYDRTNNVFYTTTLGGKTIKRSTSAFAFTTLSSTIQSYGASLIALDATGNMYMRNNADAGTSASNSIVKITPGNVISYIASSLQAGTALAVHPSGDIYFNGNYYDPRIWVTTPGGVVTLFNADLASLSDMQFDNAGNLYTCGNGIIYTYTAGGVRSVFAANVSNVNTIKFDTGGQLYAGTYSGTIYKISNLGVATVYVTGVGNVSQIDFDPSGNLLFINASSGILYTISATILASTTVLSVDNTGNVIASSSNGISNSSTVYNNVPGSMTVNGSLHVEEDIELLPYQNEHTVNITNTTIDLGTQMIPYLAKYKRIRFILPANSIFTWNVPVGIAPFQYVTINGTGNSNLVNITSQINMTANRVYTYSSVSYKDVMRANISSFAYLGFDGVFINHTYNDALPIGTGGQPALFYLQGISPTLNFGQTIVNSAEHISTGSYASNANVLMSYTNITKNAGAPIDIEFIYTPGQPWSHANVQRFMIYRYPGTGSSLGVGVNLDMPSGKIIMM